MDDSRDEELRLRAALEALPVGIWMTDANGRITGCNRTARQIWGSPVKKSAWEFSQIQGWEADKGEPLGPEDWPLPQVLRTGEAVPPQEIIILGSDGECRTILYAAAPIRNDSGELIGAVAVEQDVSERKRLEKEVLSIAEIPQENPHPLLRLGSGGEILFTNSSAAILVEEEKRLRGEALPRQVIAAAAQAFRTGKSVEVEMECAVGRTFSFFCVPISDRPYVNLYGRDITESMRRERRLRLLSNLAEELLTAETPVEAARSAFRMVSEELDLHAYFNYLIDAAGDLRLDSFSGIPEHAAQLISHLKTGEAVCSLVAETKQSAHIKNIQNSTEPRVELLRRFGFHAYFCHPLMIRNQVLGTLSFATRSLDQFSVEDLDFLRTVVRYVSLSNQRLWAEKEERVIAGEREHLLRQSQQWAAEMDATIEAIAAPIVIYNPVGDIVRMNSAAEELFAYSPEAWNQPIAERFKKLQVEAPDGTPLSVERSAVGRALKGETGIGEIMVLHVQGRTTWASTSAAPIRSPGGEIMGAVAAFVDITPLHVLQREREMYVHTISHDLRTPLTVILGHAQLMEPLCGEQEQQTHIRAILKGAERMSRMIEDLVEAARLEGGAVTIQSEAIPLDHFISDLLQRSSTALDASRITVEASSDLPPVSADPNRLERILTNLLTNALKYSPSDSPVEIRAQSHLGMVKVSIHDYGQGIAPEDLPYIFDRFHRSRTRRETGSVGLGLYIARSLIQAHGGEISVESSPGVGTTFYFTLPVSRA